jgi:ribonuclease HII
MQQLHLQYPIYNWQKNKGYPTAMHRKMVLDVGFSPYHRKTFRVSF